jgi:ligand-binding sensor domain-containing protein
MKKQNGCIFLTTMKAYSSIHWKGNCCITGKGGGPSGLEDGNISFAIPKNDSTLWIGGYEGGGLNILNTHNNLFTRIKTGNNNSSLGANAVSLNYTDRDKNEWIATTNGSAS